MKFSIKTSDNRKRKAYIDNNDISKCVTGLRIDIEPLMPADITLHTTADIDDIIEDDANIYIMLGDKKYRIVEEV